MNFLNDKEKMRDLKNLSKADFLKSYSYITDEEYEETKYIDEIIREEIEAYIAMNGEIGNWGNTMRDEVGVDCVLDMLNSNELFTIKIDEVVEERVRELLIINELELAINELISAINNNIETINVGNEFGQDNYIPMIRLQYINDELNEIKNLIN